MFGRKTNREIIKEFDDKIVEMKRQLQSIEDRVDFHSKIQNFLLKETGINKMKEHTVRDCPFCGHRPSLNLNSMYAREFKNDYFCNIVSHEKFTTQYFIHCDNSNCTVRPKTLNQEKLIDAVNEWNTCIKQEHK